MLSRLIVILSFFAFSIYATNFENIEFSLPFKDWQLLKEIKIDKYNLRLYCPIDDNKMEFFGINIVDSQLDQLTESTLKNLFKLKDSNFKITVIDLTPLSAVVKWESIDPENNSIEGLGKVLLNGKKHVLIMYYTNKIEVFKKTKHIWIETIKAISLKP